MAEVLLDIAQNASIRGKMVDGENRFSVLDFIKYVCPGRGYTYATQVWKRLISNDSDNSIEVQPQVLPEWKLLKFSGKGQKNTPCMTVLGLQKLLIILGTKASVEFRDRVVECFNRVLAGDRTLIREIDANAERNGPVQQIARAALAEQAAGEGAVAPAGEAAAQITGEEAEMQREERRLELKRKAVDLEFSVKERDLAMDKEKLSIDREKFTLDKESKEWEAFFPLDAENKKLDAEKKHLDVIGAGIQYIETVDPDWRQNKKLQTQARDRLASVLFGPPAIQDDADAVPAPPTMLTVRQVADSLKIQNRIRGKIDDAMLQRAGREVVQKYRAEVGQSPPECPEVHKGQVQYVKSYPADWRARMEAAIMQEATGGSQSIEQYMRTFGDLK